MNTSSNSPYPAGSGASAPESGREETSTAHACPPPVPPTTPVTGENTTDGTPPGAQPAKSGFFRRTSKSLKAFTIGLLVLILLIPVIMIKDLIHERERTQEEAIKEVSTKWSTAQTLTGPSLTLSFMPPVIKDGKIEGYANEYVTLLPDQLAIDGQLKTETRRRGIYQVNVYTSVLKLTGSFSARELRKYPSYDSYVRFDQATLGLGLTDLRGVSEQITVQWGDSTYVFEPGIERKGLESAGVSARIDAGKIRSDSIPFEITVKLKGSQSLSFVPVGKTTRIDLRADWPTPSFAGSYLPESYEVDENGFQASWQVLHLNRNYPQAFDPTEFGSNLSESAFGVNLRMPVDEYQQSMRSAKYALLIIALTFIVIFFVEIMNKNPFHVLQYFLIGVALCLFYTLLLSLSEQIGFNGAYLVAATLTVLLIGFYVAGIMKKKRPAWIIGGLLTLLYIYIFILIQLETLALLAGSLGLFIVLAMVMYVSRKIDWFAE